VGKKSKDQKLTGNILLSGIFIITIYFKQNSADPFNTPKLIATAILCGFLIGPLISSYLNQKIFKKSIEGTALILSISFITSLIWALLNTDVFIRGFIGDTQRRNGFLQYLFLVIIFLYLTRFANFEIANKFVKMVIIVSFIMSTYGLLQTFGKDFVQWANPYNAMISTMGNPNFASAILAFMASVACISFFTQNLSIIMRVMSIMSLLISVAAIIRSDSRQGLVVLAITISLFFTIKILTISKKIGVPIIGANVVLILTGILGMLQIGPLQNILYKESVTTRGYYWRAGIEMFRDNVLTGVGLDGYLTSFFRYREPNYPKTYGFEITSSNAHNVIIQFFATGGVFVGISYIMLLLFVFYCGIRLIYKVESQYKNICILLFAAWIGLQSQSIISIDFIVLAIWSWVFAALIVGLLHKVELKQNSVGNLGHSNKLQSEDYFVPRLISGIVLIPILFMVVLLNRAEEQTFYSPTYKNSNQQDLVLMNAKNVMKNPLSDPFYKFKVSLDLMDSNYFENGVSNIRFLSEQDPKQLDYLLLLSRVAVLNKDYNTAINLRELMAKLDPWNAKNYFEMGLLYKELGKSAEVNRVKDLIIKIGTSDAYSQQAKLELN